MFGDASLTTRGGARKETKIRDGGHSGIATVHLGKKQPGKKKGKLKNSTTQT